MNSFDYAEKLKDPRWQKKRLKIFQRDNWTCKGCGEKSKTLSVHYLIYLKGLDPWDLPSGFLHTLWEDCHGMEQSYGPPTVLISQISLFLDFLWIEGLDPYLLFRTAEMCRLWSEASNRTLVFQIGNICLQFGLLPEELNG